MAYQLDPLMPKGLIATTQDLDDLMACKQFNGIIIQVNIFDTIQEFQHQGHDDAINKYYNNKILEKAIIPIRR